jgi:hypothetical protein
MFCPRCGAENPDNGQVCQQCGAPLSLSSATLAPRPTSTLAIVSLAAGVAAYVFIPIIGAVIAVITGHMAIREIDRSGGRLEGRTLAVIGLVLGYIHLAIDVLVLLLFVFFGVAWCGCFGSTCVFAGLGGLLGTPTPSIY